MKAVRIIIKFIGILLIATSVYAQSETMHFPHPGKKPMVMSLRDAIMLALRSNPDVVSAELNRITQKYALIVAKNEFEPQYSLSGQLVYEPDADKTAEDSANAELDPTLTLTTHYGTRFTITNHNAYSVSTGYQPSLSLEVVQPLLRGFGRAVVMATLHNAIDTEAMNKLGLEETVRNTITTVINDYMQVIRAKYQLQVDQQTLADYEQTVVNTNKKIAAGRLAKTEVVQTEAQVATQKAAIQNDINTIHQERLTLLKDLGLNPEANIIIPKKVGFDDLIQTLSGSKSKLPNLESCKRLALQSDPGYLTEGVALRDFKRELMVAKNEKRWQLDLTASQSIGGNITTNRDISAGGLSTTDVNNSFVGLNLDVPINDLAKKQAVIDARVGLEKAQLKYQEQKREIERTTEDNLHTVNSNQEQLVLSKRALELQSENMRFANIKYNAGRISTFELIKDQQDLTTAQETVLNEHIDVINALVSLNETIGTTLDNWGVKVRY